jgi:hypothetical protein
MSRRTISDETARSEIANERKGQMGFKIELEQDEIAVIIADQEDVLLFYHYGEPDCGPSLSDCPLNHFDLEPEESDTRQTIVKKLLPRVR